MKKGILLIGEAADQVIQSRAKSHKLAFSQGGDYQVPYDKTLIVQAGTRVPWDLLPAAWNFLNRWDAAVPLWRYGVTAQDIGSEAERQLTREIVRDLRVLVHSYELLFVRKNSAGEALVQKWTEEIERGGEDPEKRLAFLRAFYQVKPRLCVLPISWLAEVRAPSKQVFSHRHPRMSRRSMKPLTRVEVAPGHFVKCAPGDEAKVKENYQAQHKRR